MLEWTRFKALLSYMALPLLRRAAVAQEEGPAPLAADVWRMQERGGAVLLVPAPPAKNNLPISWRLHLREVEGEPGLCLELSFDQTEYEPRRSGRHKVRQPKDRQV